MLRIHLFLIMNWDSSRFTQRAHAHTAAAGAGMGDVPRS
jgi:hypothetical protein